VEDHQLEVVDSLEQALRLAYLYIDRREHTVSEVRLHLQAKGLDDSAIDETLSNLLALGVLDDARFARVFAEDKRELEQWGADRIRRSLCSRGVDRDVIEAEFRDQSSDGELARALAVLGRRFPVPPRDRRERDRALGVLLRKGYDGDTSLAAINSYARASAES
jgi:regulatory protein